jgi:transcriptional regulator with XRE-family HTH domain
MNADQSDMDISLHIGHKLREQRKKAGITLSRISKILNVTYQQIQKYENGYCRIPVDKLYDFSVLFDIPVQYFFEGLKTLNGYSKAVCGGELIPKRQDLHLNVIIIDDSPADEFMTRKAIHEIDKNIVILCVQSESQVMNCLKRRDVGLFAGPDIIFMDISISKHNYPALISEIKREKHIQEVPLIILTHSIMVEDLLRAYRNGATSFICKSMDFEVFKNDMRICIEYWGKVVMLPGMVRRKGPAESAV